MEKNELSLLFEKSISFNKIDKSKYNFNDKPLEQQLINYNILNKN